MRKSYQKALKILREHKIAEVQLVYTSNPEDVILRDADSVKDYIASDFSEGIEHRETMWMIMLNRNHRVLGKYMLGKGGVASTQIDFKIALQAAILANSSGIILIHNHPSGNLTPSESDIKLTRRFKQACELCDLSLLDHLIITSTDYNSIIDH